MSVDRIASRKLHLSPEQGKIFEKANKMFDDWQNDITLLLAQEYLETGSINPEGPVIDFFSKKGVKGFITKSDSTGTRDTVDPLDRVQCEDSGGDWVFPCLVDVDGTSVVIEFVIEKIKDRNDANKKIADAKTEVKSSNENDNLMNFRNSR